MLFVGDARFGFALGVGGNDLAVIAASEDVRALGDRRQDAAVMHRDALLGAVRRDKQQRFLAEHEHRATFEEMDTDTGAPAANGLRPVE